MVCYAARAVPWVRVALAAVLVVLLMELVRWRPWVLWPLEGTAIGVLAGASAWCFDESAAVVVDVAPRSLAWRTSARMPAVLGLVLVWCAVVSHAGDRALFDQSGNVLVQGLVAIAVGAGYAGWRRAWGEPTPGLALATAVVPLTTAWALVRPWETRLPVFPYGTSSAGDWSTSTVGWVVLGGLALVALAAALSDAPWWSVRGSPGVAPYGR
ncbi:hypothetical protein [uncultured Friedmanniella sp.]|uniref:hypothetical protein n=1 Tax=uncultured Friedmanniella sp. TaxID=335381 RepID=UPI0035C95B6C